MKAEELRIGNYVKIDAGIGKVVSLMSNTFCNECANDDYNITIEMDNGTFREEEETKVEGIPLTEEILLNCGFEKINHISGYIFYSFDRNYKREKFAYMPLDVYLNPNYAKIANFTVQQNVEYVHQLQNLFYAINGKELNIQL
jgi:hypothetical protein|nr:MAG TPA: hypothetical protein [Caudoviricetes sp.]